MDLFSSGNSEARPTSLRDNTNTAKENTHTDPVYTIHKKKKDKTQLVQTRKPKVTYQVHDQHANTRSLSDKINPVQTDQDQDTEPKW